MFGRSSANSRDNDQSPLFYIRGYPVYSVYLIMGVMIISMLVTTLAIAVGSGAVSVLAFHPQAVLQLGAIWQPFTYVFVNPPSFGFALAMFLLFMLGRDLEQFLGRARFLWLYGHAILVPPLVQLLWGPNGSLLSGCAVPNVAVFTAFSYIYPGVHLFFSLSARLLFFIYAVLQTLIYLAGNAWGEMFGFLAVIGTTWVFVETVRGRLDLAERIRAVLNPRFVKRAFAKKPQFRVVPRDEADDLRQATTERHRDARGAAAPEAKSRASTADIDRLLDKINKSGIGSLTPEERERLQKASEEL
jgi:membrane associated rhomboid family serine protease